MVHIPAGELTLNRLNLYAYQAPQTSVSFMVIRRSEDDYAVALNACSICPPVGYHQEGEMLICDNCNAPINLMTVGMPGGCNPIPLEASLAGDELVISAAALDGAQTVFARK